MDKTPLHPYWKKIIVLHFHPDMGSPYWIETSRRFSSKPARDLRFAEDLLHLGPMDRAALETRPVEDFVPRRFHAESARWILGETGGTTGMPARTVYFKEEFHDAFVLPFLLAAKAMGFPKGGRWLWIGPSGPHIIGKAACACAMAMGSGEPFTVDFDPRWIRKFDVQSIQFRRYFDHVIDQALAVLATQRIDILFTTPPVLARLAEELDETKRHAMRGLHVGGMSMTREVRDAVTRQFPNAVLLSGYGNTLFGMCPELERHAGRPVVYYPHGRRLRFEWLDEEVLRASQGIPSETRLSPCSGRLMFSRFDAGFLILNMIERDRAGKSATPARLQKEGFQTHGVVAPEPARDPKEECHETAALY